MLSAQSIAICLLTLAYLICVPFLVMRLSRRWAWIEKVSPMTVLYAIGLIAGNIGLLPAGGTARAFNATAGNIAIAIALPSMLMGCNLRQWSTGKSLKAFFSGLAAVILMTFAGYFLFRGATDGSLSHRDYAQVCAVATGIYTGGIPNMGAIKQGIGMKPELFLCITIYDLIVTSIYLVFVVVFGKSFFRKILPSQSEDDTLPPHLQTAKETRSLSQRIAHYAILLCTPASVAAISALVASIGGTFRMSLFVLALTTLAIGCSFLPFVRKRSDAFFCTGLFFVYIFCLSVATGCDVRQLNVLGNLDILAYLVFVVFGSVLLQTFLGKLLKLDGDMVLVTSVALINSPPFVPMVAALLKNRSVILTGVFVGLLGYMLGNYLGIGIFHLLLLME